MKKATATIFIDHWHPSKDGNCAVSLRVTYDRKKKYYSTGINATKKDFDSAMTSKRRSEGEKKLFLKLRAFEAKALEVIEKLPIFTFPLFENLYVKNRGAADTIEFAFDEYIAQLKQERRVGTATSYESAKKSLEAYKPGLRFADITPTLLKAYENWMYDNDNSATTVGIYLRSLRTIFNLSDIDRTLYPFSGKNKYKIPTGRNIKKALTLEEISAIYHAKLEPDSTREMARDYWIFIYLCNGINVKDLCLLKYKNIDGNFIKLERAKTKRTKKDVEEIRISIKEDADRIIKKWGQRSVSPDTYIFPHLQKGITAERERQLIQQLTRLINGHMEAVTADLKINKPVTTYTARHSFATVLKRSGASIEFISDALGHGDIKTTQAYLAGFEDETLEKVTEALTAFKR